MESKKRTKPKIYLLQSTSNNGQNSYLVQLVQKCFNLNKEVRQQLIIIISWNIQINKFDIEPVDSWIIG